MDEPAFWNDFLDRIPVCNKLVENVAEIKNEILRFIATEDPLRVPSADGGTTLLAEAGGYGAYVGHLRLTVDPRKLGIRRFEYEGNRIASGVRSVESGVQID